MVVGFGLGRRAWRGVFGFPKRQARLDRGLVTRQEIWPDMVVVATPDCQRAACFGEAVEDILVEEFDAQAAAESKEDEELIQWIASPQRGK